MADFLDINRKIFMAACYFSNSVTSYYSGILKYLNEFLDPFWISLNSFNSLERQKLTNHSTFESLRDYISLLQFNLDVAKRGFESTINLMEKYHSEQFSDYIESWLNTISGLDKQDIEAFAKKQAELMKGLVYDYPEIIKNIKPKYGFHFDSGGYIKAAETESFTLWQVLPTDKNVKVRKNGKPIIIIPPYVLGANILCFLPGEGKSYVHAYANQGIPTYIRIMKDINTVPSVQTLDGEEDALQTQQFCGIVKKKHGKMVTINGFCQGGFIAMLDIVSGALDGLVDALITCVTPMDGTRSKALIEYLAHLPQRFRDLGYAVKEAPSGNLIVDGKVMSWVYKLKSMDKEAPLVTFYRDLMMIESSNMEISNTAAALNYWLLFDRNDLPVKITQLSFDSYTIPVGEDGTLPVTLFGKKLNFKYLDKKKIKVLMCYAESDDLVDAAAALAPADFIKAEITKFPKGHGAIATSWSDPKSECALHTVFHGYRGPVRFQLDLEKEK